MKMLMIGITRRVLYRVVARACASTIPRSGNKGAEVNCFVTAVDRDGAPYLIVLQVEGDELVCIEWDGAKYKVDRKLPIASFKPSSFRITHYYGLSTVEYQGVLDFVLGQLTAWPYIKIHTVQWLSSFDQYLFNKKKLISKQRMELLKYLVEQAQAGRMQHETFNLMTELYSIRWVLHPQREAEQAKLEFYLDALADTGELRKNLHNYVVTGFALRAIEEYEEQERKHTENVKMQWRTFWLAVAVAALTLVQAGLMKLPALIDLTV